MLSEGCAFPGCWAWVQHSHAVEDEAQEHEDVVALVKLHIADQALAQLAQVAGPGEALLVHEGAPGPDGGPALLQPFPAHVRGDQFGQQTPGDQMDGVGSGQGSGRDDIRTTPNPHPGQQQEGIKGCWGPDSGTWMKWRIRGGSRFQGSGLWLRGPRMERVDWGALGWDGVGRTPGCGIRGSGARLLTWHSAPPPPHPSAGSSRPPCLRRDG